MERPRQKTDAELKAEFIASRGVTRIEAVRISEPPPSIDVPAARKPPKPRAERPMNVTPAHDRGSKPRMIWAPVSYLHVDERYQRHISTKRGEAVIREIVENFRWKLFQPVTICPREENGYWLIDGQHRVEAAKLAGIKEVPAILIEGLTLEERAKVFAGINGSRVAMNPLTIFHAMLAAGDPVCLRVSAACAAAGVVIPRSSKLRAHMKPEEATCIASLRRIMLKYGDTALTNILKSIRKKYPRDIGMITAIRMADELAFMGIVGPEL